MKVIGTGSALPKLAVTNDMLAEIFDTNHEWIFSRTGIAQRRILSSDTLIELAVSAAKQALKSANLAATDLDFIFCANVVNPYITPGLGCVIQGEIGATCPCIDLNSGCSGFLFALDLANAYLINGKAKNILIVCAEEISKILNWNLRDASVLFGDGSGAVVVTHGEGLKSIYVTTTSAVEPLYCQREGGETPYSKKDKCTNAIMDGLMMKGKDVYQMAVKAAVHDINMVMKKANVTQKDISFYLLHQANVRIMDTIRDFLNEKDEKFPKNIQKYGNTSAASIPILLDELNKEGALKTSDMLLMCAFGAGFSSGACVMEWGV